MASTPTLHRQEWQSALDEFDARHRGERVTIEVLDESIGHQYEAERLPFASLSYDPKDDVVIVAVGGEPPRYPVVMRHMVPHPKEVQVTTPDLPEPAVRLVDPDGSVTLITFFPDHGES